MILVESRKVKKHITTQKHTYNSYRFFFFAKIKTMFFFADFSYLFMIAVPSDKNDNKMSQ